MAIFIKIMVAKWWPNTFKTFDDPTQSNFELKQQLFDVNSSDPNNKSSKISMKLNEIELNLVEKQRIVRILVLKLVKSQWIAVKSHFS